jgi:ATP-dependent Clp protease ATP-binding subunit ClpA
MIALFLRVSLSHFGRSNMPNTNDKPGDLFLPDGRLDVELFAAGVPKILAAAMQMTRKTCWDSVRSPHLFMAMIHEPDPALRRFARQAEVDFEQLQATFEAMFLQPGGPAKAMLALHREFLSDNLLRVLRAARERCESHGHRKITSIDLLLTLLTIPDSVVVECLRQLDMPVDNLIRSAENVEQEMLR